MKVKSTGRLITDLSEQARAAYHVTQDFEIELDRTFTVYSISIWRGVLHYLLVRTHEDKPEWYPADLFSIEVPTFSTKLHYMYFGPQDKRGVSALWGYKEMALDYSHYADLIEREKDAIEVFRKRKKEIDEVEGA